MDIHQFASDIGLQSYGREFEKWQKFAECIEHQIFESTNWRMKELIQNMMSEVPVLNMEDHVKQLIEDQTFRYSNLKNEVERKVQLMTEDFHKTKDGVQNVIKQMEATFEKQKQQLIGEMRTLFSRLVEDKTSVEAQAFLDMLDKA